MRKTSFYYIPKSFRNFKKGNIVNWERATLTLTNMTETDVPIQEICEPIRPGDLLMPNKVPFTDLVEICKVFNARTSVVYDKDMQTDLTALFNASAVCTDNEVQTGSATCNDSKAI